VRELNLKVADKVKLHPGFNDQGMLVDVKLGWETVRDLTIGTRKCREDSLKARRIIFVGILQFKRQNQLGPKTT
jgi:hypothetical protein